MFYQWLKNWKCYAFTLTSKTFFIIFKMYFIKLYSFFTLYYYLDLMNPLKWIQKVLYKRIYHTRCKIKWWFCYDIFLFLSMKLNKFLSHTKPVNYPSIKIFCSMLPLFLFHNRRECYLLKILVFLLYHSMHIHTLLINLTNIPCDC